ncbi:cellulose synthase-like protein E6 [Salvia hispanica]|uniref:cellulose synthase-like protein E6 n=1 Tax=Salvia hispanica TaxID=49212 RepID=UPI002008F4CB|nr:cellulose synthase-like protein E6 [Salvia hispanica]
MGGDGDLFETRAGRGRAVHRGLCVTILAGIVCVWVYRLSHIPQEGRFSWIAMLFAEAVLGCYWIISQSGRWAVVYRFPFKDKLSSRYGEKVPAVDVFVCTADPVLEPPSLVVNTVLSVMSYNYPSHKLNVYLSDDGGSQLTFYALFEASLFSKYWIPFSKKYNVEPRSPAVYFSRTIAVDDSSFALEWTHVKRLYEDMKGRIDSAAAKGSVPEHVRGQHKGFSEWNSKVEKQDHHSIVQILIDGWNPEATDVEGNRLPTLVYLSREKRPGWPHNFKAGSMNALIRVSSVISNAPIILNVDCDMYANDPDAIKDTLCFFLDENHGSQTCYVQYPQQYNNIVKNDIYGNQNYATDNIELSSLDGFGVALYVGTGCFHRRESLSGKNFSGNHRIESGDNGKKASVEELEDAAKVLANCSYEKGTLWGKEMGLVYGCPVEDIVTGLSIQCRGWKPVYYNPSKHAFKGVAPTTLDVALIQHTRWSEGMFQIFLSKYCPFILGRGKISFGGQMGYCIYLLWPVLSLPTLVYGVIPALALLRDVPLFPKVSSLWMVAFAYVFAAKTAYSLAEDVAVGDTVKGWWNVQRIVVIRRMTAYLLALIETVMRMLGLSQSAFVLTAKVVDDEAEKRYKKGLIEFGGSSIMMIIVAMVALLNLVALGWGAVKALWFGEEVLWAQLAICGVWVVLNLPVYEALLFRRDKGRMPMPVTVKSLIIVSTALLVSVY